MIKIGSMTASEFSEKLLRCSEDAHGYISDHAEECADLFDGLDDELGTATIVFDRKQLREFLDAWSLAVDGMRALTFALAVAEARQ